MFAGRGRRAGRADRKRAAEARRRDAERIGIGALVYVVPSPDGRDEWEGEPSGVVIAPGDNEIAAYPGISMGRLSGWLVAFDRLAYMKDGRGPFEQATVPGARLRLIPSGDDGGDGEADGTGEADAAGDHGEAGEHPGRR